MSVDKIAKQKVKYYRYLNKKPMTICIASICETPQSPKIVFSADRLITDAHGLTFEHGVSKIKMLTKNCFIMSVGKSSHADQIIQNTVKTISTYDNEKIENMTIEQIVEVIKHEHQKIRKETIETTFLISRGLDLKTFYENLRSYPDWFAMLYDSQIGNYNFEVEFIVFGFDINQVAKYVAPHLYKITEKGESLCFDSIGFAMIGIGEEQSFPEITKEPYNPSNALSDAIVRTYWAKKSAERMTGVGKITDLGLAWSDHNKESKIEIIATEIAPEFKVNIDKIFEEEKTKIKQMTDDIQNNIQEILLGKRTLIK